MTLSDLEMRDTGGKNFLEDFHNYGQTVLPIERRNLVWKQVRHERVCK